MKMRILILALAIFAFIGTSAGLISLSETRADAAVGGGSGQTKSLWVFGGSVVPNPVSTDAGRSRLVQTSSAEGIDTLYVSTYQPTPSSTGRLMYEDADMAALNSAAHAAGQEVWVAHGNFDWPTFGCTASDRPVQRMQDIINYNNAVSAAERFDGVMLDVEPGAAFDVSTYVALHQCLRTVLPPSIKLGTAINAFWSDPVELQPGGPVKPEYAHIIDLPLDKIVVMGYRDTAGTDSCPVSDGLICLDKDEIAYATSIGKAGVMLVGLETLDVAPGQPERVSFFEEGLGVMNAEAQLASNHFASQSGFGGISIHNYSAAYLSGTGSWPLPTVGLCTSGNNVDVESTTGTVSAGYATVKAASDAINAGVHTGVIKIEICGSTIEGSTPAVLNSSGIAPADYSSIHIYPLVDGVSISGAAPSGRGVIELKGADEITIDGDNPLTAGTGRNLTIQNTVANTTSYGQVIRIALNPTSVSSANNNTFKNLKIIGNATGRNIATVTSQSSAANSTYGILLGGGISSAANPPSAIMALDSLAAAPATATGLTIQNNEITNVGRAIAIQGSSLTVAPGLLIDRNVIGNPTAAAEDQVYSIGITVQGTNNAAIRSNTVYVESFINEVVRGIDLGGVNSAVAGVLVESNRVMRVRSNHPQIRGAFGINLYAGSGQLVQNNFVTGVTNDQTSGGNSFGLGTGAFGIAVHSGSVSNNGHVIAHNSVNLYGSIPGSSGAALTACFGFVNGSNSGMDVRNNVFSNQLTGGSANTRHAAIYIPSGVTSLVDLNLNNNAYYQSPDSKSLLAQVGTTSGSGQYFAADFNAASTSPAANLRSFTSGLNGNEDNDD